MLAVRISPIGKERKMQKNKSESQAKTTRIIISAIVLAAVMAVSFFAGYFLRDITNPEMVSLRFIVEKYKKYYLEESDDFVSIMGNSIIDRYSEYMTKEEYETVVKSAAGRRKGIGISYNKDTLSISSVKGNSPAEKAGIAEGDVITGLKKSGEEEFIDITNYEKLAELFDKITDDELFSLRLSNGGKEKVCELSFRDYQEAYVFYKDNGGDYRFSNENGEDLSLKLYGEGNLDLGEDTAYIKYSGFNGRGSDSKVNSSSWQMKVALQKFKENKKSKLILDLRNNGGGYMDILEHISAHFIDCEHGSKKLVAKAIYKDNSESRFYSSSVDYSDYGFEKIVILANTGTASASEALIGAMLDYDTNGKVSVVLSASAGGKNVAEADPEEIVYRSYGKGIMQTTYVNPFGGDAIKLTTAKIYWPVSDLSIHGVGVCKSALGIYADRIYEPTYEIGTDYELKKAISLM